MKPQSAKQKGRKLQQWVRDKLIELLDIHPENVRSTSMGAGGGEHEPLVIIKRNRSKTLAVVEAEYFINLHKD